MQLVTICKSDQGNCCMIDSKILYEGDSIKGFRISRISDNFVKLEWWGDQGLSVDNSSPSETQSQGLEIILKLSK